MKSRLLLLCLLWFFVLGMSCSSKEAFTGTVLTSPDIAPPFELQNHMGQNVNLTEMRGKVVVLTFLYTTCPDICPLITHKLHETYSLLGDDISGVEFVAISVDPMLDSIERANTYSEMHGMSEKWNFLVGSKDELEPVWKSYWLAANEDFPQSGLSGSESRHSDIEPKSPKGAVSRSHLISHGTHVTLIDAAGMRRIVVPGSSLDPAGLAQDIRLLIK